MKVDPRRLLRVTAGVMLLSTVVAGPSVAAAADNSKPGSHCVYDVVGIEDDGITLILEDEPDCYTSYAGVLRSQGLRVRSGIQPGEASSEMLLQVWLATHWQTDGTDQSLNINGAGCTGVGVDFPSSWDNIIDETDSGCHVEHYDSDSYTGLLETTNPPSDILAAGNKNRTESALYQP